MKRKALIGGLGVVAFAVLLLAIGSPTADTVSADAGTMSWDLNMDDPSGACPSPGGTNDGDGDIETNECPNVQSNLWQQPAGGVGGTEGFFDGASTVWETGALGADATGDGIADPADGLAANRPATIGAMVGEITFEISSGLSLATVSDNNVDDVNVFVDATVTGQPIPCGDASIDTVEMADSFALWNAIVDNSNGTVSHLDADADTVADTQELNGSNLEPDGVTMLPIPIPDIETTLGVTPGTALSRSFGIAKLDIVAGISNDVDVNFLVYGLYGLGGELGTDGYMNLTVVQYPAAPAADPSGLAYDPLAQTVVTCPPYWSSPVLVFGVTTNADFDEDGSDDLVVTPELNRLIIGTGGPYDYAIFNTRDEDYDGDTIPEYADRCEMDPATGTAGDDTDGDTMTGTCETTGAGNGEGNNPPGAGFVKAPPWAAGQDVDGDTILNYVDNCPQVADRDLDADTVVDYQKDTDGDTVGDVCEIDLGAAGSEDVAGDGSGYAGTFADNPTICSDKWTIGQPEPQGEAGDIADKYCLAPKSAATTNATSPYVNPALSHLRLSNYRDADNDARPDFWDGKNSACSNDPTWCPGADPHPYDYFDVDDADADGHSDACESFTGSDSLNAAVTPGAPSITDDCDGDTTSDVDEVAAGTNPLDGIESDGDGYCNDAEETAKSLDPTKWYDFFDVPVPARADPQGNGVRNGAISIGDVLAVLFYAGAANDGVANGNGVDYDNDKNSDGVEDGVDYDRTPTTPPIPPGPPDGAISISDVLAALAQSGTSCPAKGTS